MQSVLLTKADVAKRLGINVRSVDRLIRDRSITHIKVGRLCRIESHELEAYLDRQRVSAKS